jgi:sugar/nucleoside kinase (ribokinase family)
VLAVVGDLLEDIVVRVATTPALGTDTPAVIARRRGGSAANVAAAAAMAGARVRFIGCVGADEPGARLAGELAAAGVDVRVQRRGHTGAVVVLVGPDGERTMLPDRAAATALAEVDGAWLDDVTWLHVPSYSLLSEPIGATVRTMIADVRGRHGRLSVDVSSVSSVEAFGVERYQQLLAALAPDAVFANEPESGLLPAGFGALAIIKHGPRPVEVRGVGEGFTVDVPPLPSIGDTTGAGDAFAAGYLVATIGGEEVGSAVAAGIELAARVLRR